MFAQRLYRVVGVFAMQTLIDVVLALATRLDTILFVRPRQNAGRSGSNIILIIAPLDALLLLRFRHCFSGLSSGGRRSSSIIFEQRFFFSTVCLWTFFKNWVCFVNIILNLLSVYYWQKYKRFVHYSFLFFLMVSIICVIYISLYCFMIVFYWYRVLIIRKEQTHSKLWKVMLQEPINCKHTWHRIIGGLFEQFFINHHLSILISYISIINDYCVYMFK